MPVRRRRVRNVSMSLSKPARGPRTRGHTGSEIQTKASSGALSPRRTDDILPNACSGASFLRSKPDHKACSRASFLPHPEICARPGASSLGRQQLRVVSMNKTHKRFIRRDRRRAKATEWRRPGKTSMGSRVGHGTVGAGYKSFVATPLPGEPVRKAAPRGELNILAKEIGNHGLSSLKDAFDKIESRRVKK